MKTSQVQLLFFVFVLLLFFAGCGKNDNPVVQPDNSEIQPGNDKVATGSPVSQVAFTNGDMENGTNGYWAGGSYSNGSYQFNYTEDESVSPSHSLNIIASGTSKSFAYWAQTFDAASLVGKKVTVSVSAKYLNVAGDGVMLVLRGDKTEQPEGTADAFSTTQGKVIFNGTSDWKTIEINLDPVPEGIKSLTVYMLISATSGSVYFDNLNVTSADAGAPITDLSNGNMESGNYSPDNWWYATANSSLFKFAWDTGAYLSANHSLKISSEGSKEQFAFWAQTISASELIGKKVTLNVNIKAAELTGEGVYIAIRGDDSLTPAGSAEVFVTTQGNKQISGSFDWKNFSVTLDNIPSDIKYLTFYLIYGLNTSGAVYFDDISLTKE